jgi:hypothetical protein
MGSVIDSVRKNLKDTIDKLFDEVEGIRIGILAHGDYCDNVTVEKLDLTKNKDKLKEFIINNNNTGGGDAPECYEYILYLSKYMNWKSNVKILVVIGDENPHDLNYNIIPKKDMNKDINRQIGKVDNNGSLLTIDWKKEILDLKQQKIIVFSCHALPERNKSSLHFYNMISEETGGFYFPLDELMAFKDYMVAICFKAADAGETLEILNKKRKEIREEIDNENKRIKELEDVLKLNSEGKIKLSNEEENDLNIRYTQSTCKRDKDIKNLENYTYDENQSIFKSPVVNKLNKNSRTKTYTNEYKAKRQNLSQSTNVFLNTISSNPEDENN